MVCMGSENAWVVEGVPSDVVDEKSTECASVVASCDSTETLLAGCVPDLRVYNAEIKQWRGMADAKRGDSSPNTIVKCRKQRQFEISTIRLIFWVSSTLSVSTWVGKKDRSLVSIRKWGVGASPRGLEAHVAAISF